MADIDSQIEAALFRAQYGPPIYQDIGVHHKHFASDIEKAIKQLQSSGLPAMPEIDNAPFFKSMVDRPGRYCPRCGRHKTAVSNGRCALCSPGLPFVNETIAALFPAKRTMKSVVKTQLTSILVDGRFWFAVCLIAQLCLSLAAAYRRSH